MERKDFCRGILGVVTESAWMLSQHKTERDKALRLYLKRIERRFYLNRNIVKDNDIFSDFLNLSKDKQLIDYEMYYPMYKAGEISFNVPWVLTWLIHEQETRASSEPTPEKNGYAGGMQRNSYFYPTTYVETASQDWNFLEPLPQRYKKTKGFLTDDYQEILFAARKIKEDGDAVRRLNPKIDGLDSYLLAQFNYCNSNSAQQRIDHFKKIYPLFLSH